MKVVSPELAQGHFDATIEGGFKGLAFAAGLTVPTFMLLNRRLPAFKNAPAPMKVFAGVVITVPCVIITAEKAGEKFERSQWTGIGKQELDHLAEVEHERWAHLSTGDRITDWAKRRKWALITGSWAAAMVGSFAMVSRNEYQSFSQKLVQARVYAQGWTIALLLVAAILTGTGVADEHVITQKQGDSSWRDILEQEGYGDQLKQLKPHEAKQIAQAVEQAKKNKAAQ